MYVNKIIKFTMISMITSNILLAKEDINHLNSVTVTANKVEENVQDIPQSITVIESEVLQEKGINTISKIMDEIPNMNGVEDKGFGTSVNFRGLNTSMFTNSNPVVVYIDGVPITDRYSYKASLDNAKRVEVLRGPQGTLYGKDAIGAVINIVTNDTPEVLTGYIGAEYGSNNYKKINFNVSTPLLDKKLFLGLNGEFDEDDGWITNDYYSDDKAEKSKSKNLGMYVKYQPTDRLSLKLNIAKNKSKDNWVNGGAVSSDIDISKLERDNFKDVSFDMPTVEEKETDSQSITLQYLFDDFDLDFVTTHRDFSMDGDYDPDYSDGVNNLGLIQFNYTDTETYTHELRISNNENDIKWVAGLYVEDEEREQNPYGVEQYHYGSVYTSIADSLNKSKTNAIFGQAMIPLSQKLELTLGGRYQNIEKDIKASVVSTYGGAMIADFTLSEKKEWNTFLPKLALNYKHNDNISSYISASKGYMPGGYNYFPASANGKDNLFKPQESLNYEVGVKGLHEDFFYNISAFYMDITDIHVYKSVGNNWYTDNAKKAHSLGLEVEGKYFVTETIDISGSLGVIKSKYDDYDAGTTNFDGEKVENTPSHTASVTVSYKGISGLYGFINFKNQGDTSFYDNLNKKFIKNDGHSIVNTKVGYKFANWDIYTYVDNLTDEDHVTTYMSKEGLSVASFNEPRFVGVGVKYSF